MIIMHIDANSAFLSWTAAEALKQGAALDYRTVPSVIGGSESQRHGIVLAKSTPAKKYGIVTGEPLVETRRKCPGVLILPPNYSVYMDYSNAMYSLLSEYSPIIQRYSIDECFMDYTASEKAFGDPVEVANTIRKRMWDELGFTVNIGVSVNKVLAKMGSELQKPDRTHTLWPSEIADKMWPLPVEELFMVGRSSSKKLRGIGINTIGDLAHADINMLKNIFKSHGELMHNYANGIDYDPVSTDDDIAQKGFGNSITINHDVKTREEAVKYLLGISEKVSSRLRGSECSASLVSVLVKTSDLLKYSKQRKIDFYTNKTMDIYTNACELFDEIWHGEPIRQLGISTSDLQYANEDVQLSLFDKQENESDSLTDSTVDAIRERFGTNSIKRASLVGKNVNFRD